MDEHEEFLRRPHVAVLGTVNSRGQPHGAPVWYLYEGGVFIVSTGRGSRKHRNVESNPKVSLVIDVKDPPYYAVMVQGTAEIGPPLSEDDRQRLAVRYLREERGRRYAESTRASNGESVSLRITAHRFATYGRLRR